jgi:myosin-crossreactive antigen
LITSIHTINDDDDVDEIRVSLKFEKLNEFLRKIKNDFLKKLKQ